MTLRLDDLAPLILDQAPTAVSLVDLERRFAWVNERTAELCGFPDAASMVGTSAEALVLPEDLDALVEQMRGIADGDPPELRVFGLRRVDGTTFDAEFLANIVRDPEGLPQGYVVHVRDVTEQRQAQARLRHREHFELLLTSVSSGFINLPVERMDEAIDQALGRIGRMVGANHCHIVQIEDSHTRLSRTHGWTDLPDRPHGPLPWSGALEQIPWFIEQLRDQGHVTWTTPQDLPDLALGEHRVVREVGLGSVLAVPLSPGGERSGVLMVATAEPGRVWPPELRDMLHLAAEVMGYALARKLADEARRALEEQLLQAQKMEAVGRLAGGVAHDFNNLLTGIMGFTEVAMGHLDSDSSAQRELKEVERAALKASDLTRQLLAFSRKQGSQPRVLDLNHALALGQRMLVRLIGEDVRLDFEPDLDLWPVYIDPVHLDQVLVNLATNARDAMPGGGRLSMATRRLVLDSPGPDGLPPGEYALLEVSDDGSGMEPDVAGRIFEPFYSTKVEGRGTGLGLSTVYGILRQHQGGIAVETTPGTGTSFFIYLPRAQEALAEEPEPSPAGSEGGSESILLVEDEETVRELARYVLERRGYRVVARASGPEALAAAREPEAHFDLLLADVIMPQLSGRAVYDQARQLLPDLPVLYMSGYPRDLVTAQGLLDPDTPYLSKPFTASELLEAVRKVLDSEQPPAG